MRWTFDEHLRFAVDNAGHRFSPDIVAKELLHFDLLRGISESPLGDHLIFQGGTALRICYQGDRLSEDLDFVCGLGNAEPLVIEPLVTILHQQMTERYGLTFEKVKGPKGQDLTDRAQLKRWEFVITVPLQERKQRIRVEVCNVPAHDALPKLVRPSYPQLEMMEPIVLQVESEREIMADKIIALAARPWVKYRDVWDLKQLTDRGLEPDQGLIRIKAADYGLTALGLCQGLVGVQSRLQSPEVRRGFVAEMTRFVSTSMGTRLERQPQLSDEWLSNAVTLANRVCYELQEK